MMKKILALVGLCTMLLSTPGYALTLNNVEGSWSNVLGDPQYQAAVDYYTRFNNDVDIAYGNHAEDQVRWGRPFRTGNPSSGLGFTGTAESEFDFGEIFEVGQLRHFNYEIVVATAARSADLELQLGIGELPIELSLNLTMTVNETPNIGGPVDDIIGFSDVTAIQTFTYDDTIYTFELLGFGSTPDDVVTQFISREFNDSATRLFGRLTSAPVPPVDPPNTPAVPEPATMLLLGLGLIGLAALRKRAQ